MGQLLQKQFEIELSLISDDDIKNFTNDMLGKVSDFNFYGAASSSGKYHPVADLGIGGLVRHTRTVFTICARMMSCNPRYDNKEKQSIMLSACLLHDMMKFTDNADTTNNDHPLLMYNKIMEEAETSTREIKAKLTHIASIVETHMSRWNKWEIPYKSGNWKSVPLPTDEDQWLICYADMVASMKTCNFDFDNNWMITERER